MFRFDAEGSRRVEAAYRTPDLVAQRRDVLGWLAPRPGEDVLDVGVGPGFLAAQLAQAVGPEGSVSGIDISDDMLALAAARTLAPGSAGVDLRRGSADAIPYADGTFDAVVATQVLEYVVDIPAALGEARRVLRPGGRVLVLDTDWDSIVWHSGDHARMVRVLDMWERHLADPRLPRRLRRELVAAGFEPDPLIVFPVVNAGFDPKASFSAGLVDVVGDYVAAQGMPAAEVDAWKADLRGLGDDYLFTLNRYVFRARRR
jgi:SAM-dependent methyltransferase